MVQFATEQDTGVEFAIKFFISQKFFQREQDMSMQSHSPLTALGEFYPAVRNIVSNEDEAFVDAHGAPMPPCIIMEKGESLDLRRHRSKGLDTVAAVQVCCPRSLLRHRNICHASCPVVRMYKHPQSFEYSLDERLGIAEDYAHL